MVFQSPVTTVPCLLRRPRGMMTCSAALAFIGDLCFEVCERCSGKGPYATCHRSIYIWIMYDIKLYYIFFLFSINMMIYYIILYFIILCESVMNYIVFYYIIFYCIIVSCIKLYFIILQQTVLNYILLYCSTRILGYCGILQYYLS